MINKKGAIEMSMTTIIVIVLGVTLLILGLTFVRTIFTKITAISSNTFDQAQDLLDQVDQVNEFLTINPEIKDIESGADGVIKVTIANFEESSIEVTAKALTQDPNLDCGFLTEGKVSEAAGPYMIKSGGQKGLALVIKDDGQGSLRTTGCSITIEGAPEGEDNKGDIVIHIIKTSRQI